ncbi:MAG TPA: hypothetical protein VN207_04805 [Ktedonobacteraceae bacterium]|nr:hypothetical protein [Ktedonobacteraceae bacterium]
MKLYERSKPSKRKVRKVVKTTSAKAKDVARSTSKNVRNSAQETFASAKDTVQLAYTEVEKSMKLGWNKTLTWLAIATGIVVPFFQKNMQKAQKNLEKAQKNMQKMQDPLQKNVRSGLAKTSDVPGKTTSKATDSLKQATTRAKELQDSWQEQSVQRQRRRKRAKMVFRWGLIFGVALALLYSPIAGSEVRQRIGKGWQESSTYFRNRNRRLGVAA